MYLIRWVPLSFAAVRGDFSKTAPKGWLSKDEDCKAMAGMPNKDTAVIFNVQQTGFYR